MCVEGQGCMYAWDAYLYMTDNKDDSAWFSEAREDYVWAFWANFTVLWRNVEERQKRWNLT